MTAETSPVRIARVSEEAVKFAVSEGLEVMYVTEDTVRSSPEHLRILISAAVGAGYEQVTWSAPYVFHSLQVPGITASIAWEAAQGVRVLAFDVTLDRVIDALGRLPLGEKGRGERAVHAAGHGREDTLTDHQLPSPVAPSRTAPARSR